MSEQANGWFQKGGTVKYILLAVVAGLILLLWPSGNAGVDKTVASGEETRLETVLAQMQGVGRAELLLSERGAVIVCEGAEDAGVCLRITQAVRCYTGLGADKVQIFKMK